MNLPDNNPKSAIGIKKVPLHLVPPSAAHYLAHAFSDGAVKYGPYNWREKNVAASVYIAAMKRHIDSWWDGEDLSEDAKVEHLAHAMACAAIILDAASIGKLVDDRPVKGAASRLQKEYADNSKTEWKQTFNSLIQGSPPSHELVPLKELLQQATEIADSRLSWNYGNPVMVAPPYPVAEYAITWDKPERKIPFLDRFMKR